MRPKSRTGAFLQRQRNLERIARSVNEANVMLKQFTDHPADTYQLLLQLAGQIAFEAALASPRRTIKLQNYAIVEFTNLLIKTRYQHPGARKFSPDRQGNSARLG